jgi:hypothetical protein
MGDHVPKSPCKTRMLMLRSALLHFLRRFSVSYSHFSIFVHNKRFYVIVNNNGTLTRMDIQRTYHDLTAKRNSRASGTRCEALVLLGLLTVE